MSTVKIPTVRPSLREDAEQLYYAFKGRGCETSVIIEILAHRDATQRALIEQEYETRYSQDLHERLKSELHGNLKKSVRLWMLEPVTRDVTILKKALKGTATDHKAATEIICTRSGSQLRQIKQLYFNKYGTNLDQVIESQTSGNHKRLLLAYLNTTRYEGPEIDSVIVEQDAGVLRSAVARKHGSADDKTLIQIFSDRSKAHLAALTVAYREMFRKELGKAIKNETHGNFEHALQTILQCAENPALYFAKALRNSMKGLGTADSALIRIITTRAEVDMQHIKVQYKKKYGKTLNSAVHSDTSGYYRTFLCSLLGPKN